MDNNQINNKGGNGPKMNMPKFNMNWIYILAILARSFEQQHRQDGILL